MLRPVLCRTQTGNLQIAVSVTACRKIGERSTPKNGKLRGPRRELFVVAFRRGISLGTRRIGIAQVIKFPPIDDLGEILYDVWQFFRQVHRCPQDSAYQGKCGD